MRVIIFYVLMNLCGDLLLSQTPQFKASEEFKKVEWVVGTWHRVNPKPGRSGVEVWKKVSNAELHGRGISMKGNDTTFVEKLKITVKENNLYYIADVPENKGLVYFKFVHISDSGFTCENPGHDFPKKIQYELAGKQLKATISGGGKTIEYGFEREK